MRRASSASPEISTLPGGTAESSPARSASASRLPGVARTMKSPLRSCSAPTARRLPLTLIASASPLPRRSMPMR
jgi:hypothetical protein